MSSLQAALEDYLATRRALGYKMEGPARALRDFVSFLDQEGAEVITIEGALRWARKPEGVHPSRWGSRLSMVRRFADYHKGTDPRTEVPPPGLLPDSHPRRSPYICSEEEIRGLLQATEKLPSPMGLRARTYSTLFGLLAVTGMRVGESVALAREDVDWDRAVVRVRHAKFGKSRLVPVHPSTLRALSRYARRRDRLLPRPPSQAFFLHERGARLTADAARRTFVKLSCQIGLRTPSRSHGHGPRLHDLRHRFAVETLLGWYRAGVDVERYLPRLSTYLGHGSVRHTYWYLTATPELWRAVLMRLPARPGEVLP